MKPFLFQHHHHHHHHQQQQQTMKMMMMTIRTIVSLLLLALCTVVAWVVPPSSCCPLLCFATRTRLHDKRHCTTTTATTMTQLAARQICTFEADDFGDTWPYDDATDLRRLDESDDESFYDQPRFVTHIDDRAIASLTAYYQEEFTRIVEEKKKKATDSDVATVSVDVLDLCSSWISHLPTNVPLGRVAGVGMNEAELDANKKLTEFHVQNLNLQPQMPQFADASFDVICNVVSVDYLTKPREIFQEMHRILRPGGVAIMSFSNRMFATKAVNVWLQADDIGRLSIVGSYFYHSAPWSQLEALDLKPEPQKPPERPSVKEIMANPSVAFAWANAAAAVSQANAGDPLFAVKGTK